MGLNKQKGNMYGFIDYTWNTCKGKCPHDCSYCHPANTNILMGDFSIKCIEDIKIDDEIIGLSKTNNKGYYKFVKSKVVNKSKRYAEKLLKITTKENILYCTPEHPLMGSTENRNGSDWKSAKSFSPFQNLRYVHKGVNIFSKNQRFGYLKGIIDGDGCIFNFKNKEGNQYKGFEIVCVNDILYHHIKKEIKSLFGIVLNDGIKRASKNSYGNDCKMLHTRRTNDVLKIVDMTKYQFNTDYARGYIAGMIDTNGSVGKNGTIRISQSEIANKNKFQFILDCLGILEIDYVKEKDCIRINSSFEIKMFLLFDCGVRHSIKSNRLIFGNTVKGTKHSEIIKIEKSSGNIVYNLQTECENFIANGFIVHNCYMKRFPQPELHFDEKELKTNLGSDNYIFVGSSCDMWANQIPSLWIERTLDHCNQYNKNRYLFQSKNPERFSDVITELPENTILSTTIETTKDEYFNFSGGQKFSNRIESLILLSDAFPIMITIEPIMDFELDDFIYLLDFLNNIHQINIGADSGNNNLPEPSKNKILELIKNLEQVTTVFQKPNLKRLLK